MHSCFKCGRTFKFLSKLKEHHSTKKGCSTSKKPTNNVDVEVDLISESSTNVHVLVEKDFMCSKCDKTFSWKSSMSRHEVKCNGCPSLQCPICLKVFTSKHRKYEHKKNVKCKSLADENNLLKDEGIKIKFENNLLKREGIKIKKEFKLLLSKSELRRVETVKIEQDNHKAEIVNLNLIKQVEACDFDGMIYLLKEREFIKSKESVYKVGRTACIDKRMKKYPKGSYLILCLVCKNTYEVEKLLLTTLNLKYLKRKDFGSEYFEGDVLEMMSDISSLVNNANKS
jgi:hypothetical protein